MVEEQLFQGAGQFGWFRAFYDYCVLAGFNKFAILGHVFGEQDAQRVRRQGAYGLGNFRGTYTRQACIENYQDGLNLAQPLH